MDALAMLVCLALGVWAGWAVRGAVDESLRHLAHAATLVPARCDWRVWDSEQNQLQCTLSAGHDPQTPHRVDYKDVGTPA
jgi:hypothetical protein